MGFSKGQDGRNKEKTGKPCFTIYVCTVGQQYPKGMPGNEICHGEPLMLDCGVCTRLGWQWGALEGMRVRQHCEGAVS